MEEGDLVNREDDIKRRGTAEVWRGYGTAVCNDVFLRFDVLKLALSHSHGLLLTAEHNVYYFRFQEDGMRPDSPSLVSELGGFCVVDVACGPGRSAALCEDGSLYMWGDNSLGQCGFLPTESLFVDVPTPVLLREHVHACSIRGSIVWHVIKVVQVTCGENHTLALSDTGEVWAWGSGLEMGQPPNVNCVGPSKVAAFRDRRVTSIACGAHHALVVVVPMLNSDRHELDYKLRTPSGCSICDEIFAHVENANVESERDHCPLGLPLQHAVSESPASALPPKQPKDKKTKNMENAAYGNSNNPQKIGSDQDCSPAEMQHAKDCDPCAVTAIADTDNTAGLGSCQVSAAVEHCLTEAIQSSNFSIEVDPHLVGKLPISEVPSGTGQQTTESAMLVAVADLDLACAKDVKVSLPEEIVPPALPDNSSKLLFRDILTSGGSLSMQSVKTFLSRQWSTTSKQTVATSDLGAACGMSGNVSDHDVQVKDSSVSQFFNDTEGSFDEFTFVSKYGWAANDARLESSLQDLELMSCNSKDAEMASDLSDSCHLFDETTVGRVTMSPEPSGGAKPSKVSSCERVNHLHNFAIDPVHLLLHSKDNLKNVNYQLSWQTEVWSWGKGVQGQLGHGDALDRSSPVCVKTLNHIGIVKVVAGFAHSLALTASGEVYVWGSNSLGQIAVTENELPSYSPQLLKISDGAFVWDICAGSKSSLFLLNHRGEQEILFCGKQEGPLKKAASNKTAALTPHPLLVKNCRIRQIFAGGPYGGCILDQITCGHLGTLYELTITELHFFSFLDQLNKLALLPILENDELFGSICNASTLQQLFESFNDIAKNSAQNGHRLRYLIQHPVEQAMLPLFHDLEQQLNVYRTYCDHFCDVLAINGFDVCVKVAQSVFKKASKALWDLGNEVGKGSISPETLQHLMEEPIRRMTQYKKLFCNLAEQHKRRDWPSHWELLVAEKWGRLVTQVSIQKQASERTRAFWDSCPRKVADALKMPLRRFLRDSKSSPLNLMNASKFSSHWFIIFNDVLVHSHFSGIDTYDLALVWVDPAPDLQLGNGNVFSITLPEDTLTLFCASTHAKVEWVCCLNDAINSRLKLSQSRRVSRGGTRRYQCVRRTPPLSRHAAFTFTKGLLYKEACYNGMWFCGQMQGQGELTWPDGRKYVGRFRQNKQDGYGTCIVEVSDSQTVYEGLWKNGKLDGIGNIKYPNGDTYEGYFKDGLRHGHGVLKSGRFIQSAASIYVGQWVNDSKEGYGIMDDIENGEKYMGMWHEDVCHGKAMLVTLDGIYFEGNFNRGHMGGLGLIYDNNSWYEGEVGPKGTFNGKGLLTLASGDIIDGHFTGSWSNGIKINGIFSKAVQQRLALEKSYPNSFGTLCVSSNEKWNDIFHHCYEQLGVKELPADTCKAWETMAVVITNWKKHLKPTRSRQFQLAATDMNILERIPPVDEAPFSFEKYGQIKTYLRKAFDTPYHPLGKLMDGLVDVYRATYVGIGAHPCLLWHAVEEVRSLIRRINDVIRILFPILPRNGGELIFDVLDDDGTEGAVREEVITTEGLLLPVFLPKIYPPLFTLYALHYEKDDNVYWETLLKWNKQPDIALMAFLDVDEKFWLVTGDADMVMNKRASMSAIREVHYTKAIDTLQQLSTTFSPHEKLLIVQKVFEEINYEVQSMVSSDYMWTMDDLFPVFQYVVVRACIKHLGSEIHMVDDLMEKRLQNGELGIMFTMLKACYFQVANERCLVV